MTVDCFFLNWNEADIIALTLKHYGSFCRRIVVYDNYSDDNSPEIARWAGAEVRQFGTPGVLDDFAYLEIKNNCWKGSDADYVLVCDADEILYHEDLPAVLDMEKKRGTTLFRTNGINMFSERMPLQDFAEITTGIPDGTFSKSILFDPKAIREIDYLPGCHVARPQGRVEVSLSTVDLRHYRCIGGFERFKARHEQYNQRLSERNRRYKMGNYEWVESPNEIAAKRIEFEGLLERSKASL